MSVEIVQTQHPFIWAGMHTGVFILEVDRWIEPSDIPMSHQTVKLTVADEGVVVEVQPVLDPGRQCLEVLNGENFDPIGRQVQQGQVFQSALVLDELQGEAGHLVLAQVELLQAIEPWEGCAVDLRDLVVVEQQNLQMY